jgi:hypothetical protein
MSLVTVTVGINFCTHILRHMMPTIKTRNFAVKDQTLVLKMETHCLLRATAKPKLALVHDTKASEVGAV